MLMSIDNIEEEKELLEIENKRLLSQLQSSDKPKVFYADDRISNLAEQVSTMLSHEDVEKNQDFKDYLVNLDRDLASLTVKIKYIEEGLYEKFEKHEEYINNLNAINEARKEIKESDVIQTSENNIDILKENNDIAPKIEKVETKKNENKEVESSSIDNKLEFKIGSNLLNALGVIMILIAFITFGKYIYSHYMSDVMKGFFLFLISSTVLYLGENVFQNKNPKFAIGISALGIGGLYASLVINYLVLNTINATGAIPTALVITGLSLLISYKHNSNTIRIIGLIGGYGCLVPINPLSIVESYVTIIILLIISISNAYVSINNKHFVTYSSILNSIICLLIASLEFLNINAAMIYTLSMLILNNYVYIKTTKESYESKDGVLISITNFILLMSSMTVLDYVWTSIKNSFDMIQLLSITSFNEVQLLSIILVVYVISYIFAHEKLKAVLYSHMSLIYLQLISMQNEQLGIVYDILLNLLVIETICLAIKYKSQLLYTLSTIVAMFTALNFMDADNILICITYIITFEFLMWYLSEEYKDSYLINVFRWTYLTSLILGVSFSLYLNAAISFCIIGAICVLQVMKNTNIERYRYNGYKSDNKFILISTFILINLFSPWYTIESVIMLYLGCVILMMLANSKYTECDFMKKNGLLMLSLYITYGIVLLSLHNSSSYMNDFILSIGLITFASINIVCGFKFDKPEIRKYGLILSLLVCAKLLIVDFYNYEFIIRAIVFFVVGVAILAISYIYSKLEQDLKNRLNDSENNSNTSGESTDNESVSE